MRTIPTVVAAVVAAIVLAGCANTLHILETPDRLLGHAMRSAADSAGARVGEAVGDAVVRRYTPQFTRWYTEHLIDLAFHMGGFSVENATVGYRPGEYTQWLVQDDSGDETNRMRRALLAVNADGNEWWQIVYEDTASEDRIILEALFTQDRDSILRLRTQFPNEDSPSERPVADYRYSAPRHLAIESIEGATEAVERITVPAGTFQTRRVAYGNETQGRIVWWLSDDVPGGIARYATIYQAADEKERDDALLETGTVELEAYGGDARTLLETDFR